MAVNGMDPDNPGHDPNGLSGNTLVVAGVVKLGRKQQVTNFDHWNAEWSCVQDAISTLSLRLGGVGVLASRSPWAADHPVPAVPLSYALLPPPDASTLAIRSANANHLFDSVAMEYQPCKGFFEAWEISLPHHGRVVLRVVGISCGRVTASLRPAVLQQALHCSWEICRGQSRSAHTLTRSTDPK